MILPNVNNKYIKTIPHKIYNELIEMSHQTIKSSRTFQH